MNNSIKGIFALGVLAAALASCTSRGNNPGWEYAPDMYYSKGYEAYNQGDSNVVNPHGMSMREPVEGTVAMGKMDYYFPYENTAEGYEASAALTFPAGFSDPDGRGKYLYGIYCSPCHGATGGNDGEVFKPNRLGKPAWANYQDPYIQTLPVGKIYHVITYGRNNMGSHASVLAPMDRWRVIKYVKELSGAAVNTTAPAPDSTQMSNTGNPAN